MLFIRLQLSKLFLELVLNRIIVGRGYRLYL